METITLWVRNLVFYIVFLTLVFNLLPSGKYEKYVRLFAGMVFILVAVQPFTSSLKLDEKIACYFEAFSFREEAAGFQQELTEMEKRRMEELTGEYEQAVADQVKEMALEAGVDAAQVEVRIDSDQASETFGMVEEIRVTGRMSGSGEGEREQSPGGGNVQEEGSGPVESRGRGEPGGAENRVEIPEVEAVEPVRISGGSSEELEESGTGETEAGSGNGAAGEAAALGSAVSAEAGNGAGSRLRRRIADYYDLEESHVEIQLEYE